jgi:hypothetical protein
MRPHPRIRKTIKWVGAAVTVLLVVVWVGSRRHSFGWVFPHGYLVSAGWGEFAATHLSDGFPVPAYGAWYPDMCASDWSWWYGEHRATLVWNVHLPAWVPVTGLLVVTATAWRLDALARRRPRFDLCPKCGYHRAGLAAGAKCPECGYLPA